MNLKKIASTGFNPNNILQNSPIGGAVSGISNLGSKLSKLKSVASVANVASGGSIVDAAKAKGIGLQGAAAQSALSKGFGGAGSLKASIQSSLPDIGGGLPDVGGLAGNLTSGFTKSVKLPKLNVPSLSSIEGVA